MENQAEPPLDKENAPQLRVFMRGYTWTNSEHLGTRVLDTANTDEAFGKYHLPGLEIEQPGGGLLGSMRNHLLRGAMFLARIEPDQPSNMLLPRPRCQYNRLIFHVLAVMIADLGERCATLNIDIRMIIRMIII